MSRGNVEIVRTAIEAFNRKDLDRALKDAAADFEFDMSRAAGPFRGVYGLDQIRGFLNEIADPWQSIRIEPHEFIEAGEHVVVPLTFHAQGRDGIEVHARPTQTFTCRNGAIERVCMYQERDEALEAAGREE
jgi:ketosteroid isomerase-like protein